MAEESTDSKENKGKVKTALSFLATPNNFEAGQLGTEKIIEGLNQKSTGTTKLNEEKGSGALRDQAEPERLPKRKGERKPPVTTLPQRIINSGYTNQPIFEKLNEGIKTMCIKLGDKKKAKYLINEILYEYLQNQGLMK